MIFSIKYREFSFKNIDHFSTSSLVTRLTTDITNIQMAYMMTIRMLVRAPIMIILSLVMTLTIQCRYCSYAADHCADPGRGP